jgi:hypothetical protein
VDVNSREFADLIYAINFEFYEQIYKDNWFKQVFRNIAQELITSQQTHFMIESFGGPSNYCGRSPGDAHPHIYIDESMWQLRENYLAISFQKNNAPDFVREKWLKIDNAFKNKIIKNSIEDVRPRFATDEIIIVLKDPEKKAI